MQTTELSPPPVLGPVHSRRTRVKWPRVVVLLVAVAVIAATAGFVLSTRSWANQYAEDERLLPGTVVAGVAVGEQSVEEATVAVTTAVDEELDRDRVVTGAGDSWDVSPRELGATADAATAVDAARSQAAELGWISLARIRWTGGAADIDVPVAIEVDEEAVADYVAEIAETVDRPARDAALEWSDDGVDLITSQVGREVDREAAAVDLGAALGEGGEGAELAIEETAVAVTTEQLEPLVANIEGAVDSALDRQVTVAGDDRSWSVTPRELGATPELDDVVAAALDAGGDTVQASNDGELAVPLTLPDDSVAGFVATVAGEIDVAPRDAGIDHSSGWVEFTEGRAGQSVDRAAAEDALDAALHGNGDASVELQVETVAPQRSTSDFRHVLLVRQGDRRLYHYVDGEIAAEWDVAIGASGSPTPTGVFSVGWKREAPTWTNPDPDGWGSDMPAVIEPGPDNPLGVRALNWNNGGADTLIRFHGTAAEDSIGEAASKGCVRLTNADVVDLFDRVPTGATIVSVH